MYMNYDYEGIESLKGHEITEAWINDDKTLLILKGKERDFSFYCEGDCCSESWIEHIHIPFNFGVIEEIKHKFMDGLIGTRQESDRVYSYEFSFKGNKYDIFAIEFRNSSNGYYGGALSLLKTKPDGTFKKVEESF